MFIFYELFITNGNLKFRQFQISMSSAAVRFFGESENAPLIIVQHKNHLNKLVDFCFIKSF